jgi:hypothetical protein
MKPDRRNWKISGYPLSAVGEGEGPSRPPLRFSGHRTRRNRRNLRKSPDLRVLYATPEKPENAGDFRKISGCPTGVQRDRPHRQKSVHVKLQRAASSYPATFLPPARLRHHRTAENAVVTEQNPSDWRLTR